MSGTIIRTSTDPSAPTLYDKFVSVDQIKLFLNIQTTADDVLLEQLAQRATNAVERYVGYRLRLQRIVEQLPGRSKLYLQTKYTPIQEIHSIKYRGTVVDPDDYTITDPMIGDVYKKDAWLWTHGVRHELEYHVYPHFELMDYEIDYTAGFPDPMATTNMGIKMPLDIVQATIEVVKGWFLKRGVDHTIRSKQVGDLRIVYNNDPMTTGMMELPLEAQSLLRPYQRVMC